ncbi:hypothetical protein PoB_000740400 [Plakobranchus ocellatus]|uniref:Reverse transcriptase domain-containing protein n=1 Tax=Plakobranchus ocellatus TaxID=259542 RepID=A0AAV3YF35_9GAST|nr:hypothetical protein PoB_000740400 [Plakobranchus ocellatus]
MKVNDLRQNVASETRLAYADDLVLWQHSADVKHTADADALNRDLALLMQYCAHCKMSINTTKTVYCVFSNSNPVLAQDLDVKIGKVSLQHAKLSRRIARLRAEHVKNTSLNIQKTSTERVRPQRGIQVCPKIQSIDRSSPPTNAIVGVRGSPSATRDPSGHRMGRYDATPSALKALALEKISSLDRSYAICYTDGSAENGIGNGGCGFLYQWLDGTTTRETDSVGTTSFRLGLE